jgi:hypothetical protein
MAQSGSASDILKNIPSVEVDIEGAVSLRGSSGVMILISRPLKNYVIHNWRGFEDKKV